MVKFRIRLFIFFIVTQPETQSGLFIGIRKISIKVIVCRNIVIVIVVDITIRKVLVKVSVLVLTMLSRKSIDIGIANTFQTKYWYWYCQYF